MKFTKKQLITAMHLLLDETLPSIECSKIKQEGNMNCHRCDECMLEQYIKRAKSGEKCKMDNEIDRKQKLKEC